MINMKSFLLIIYFSLYFMNCHRDDSYYHDSEDLPSRSNWMKNLKDNVKMREISIPGTHDSGARYGGDIFKCQTLTILQQLNAGIRYLDIRCKQINDLFHIYHSFISQKIDFHYVLNEVKKFLDENPSETILMKVKEEDGSKDSKLTFFEVFQKYYNDPLYNNYFWKYKDGEENPILGSIRGKIVLIQDFNFTVHYGIDADSFNDQNNWVMNHNWKLYDKWTLVKETLQKANEGINKEKGYRNYLSAAIGSFPYFVASGHSSPQTGAPRLLTGLTTPLWKNSYIDFPRVGCFIGICSIAFEGINTLTKNYINNNNLRYVGIILMDFPGIGLIDSIINVNMRGDFWQTVLFEKKNTYRLKQLRS